MSAAQILHAARTAGIMISCAESCTGGLVSAALTDLAGASAVFDRGFVTYSNAAKSAQLGVPAALIAQHGAVSLPVATHMARGALEHSNAQLSIAITGIAGPGTTSDHKPEGLVCFATAMHNEICEDTQEFGPLGRSAVRAAARDHALSLLLHRLADIT